MEHVTIRQAAARLGVSEATIRRKMRGGGLGHGKDEQGRVWVAMPSTETDVETAAAPPPETAAVSSSTLQLIDELTGERDRWVAEAAARQSMIDLLVHQAENYQVLLYEAQAQVKRLSSPPEKPPLLMERVDRREDDAEIDEPESFPPEPAIGAPNPEPEPAPARPARRSWWRR